MIYLTIINALPVKQRMKNAILENHIFTEYNLPMTQWRSVKQAFTGIFFGLPTTNILLTLSGMYTANHIIPDVDFHH